MSSSQLWTVSAHMGYGHQRAVFPFRYIAHDGIMNVGDTPNTTDKERRQWKRFLELYETFSRAKSLPIVGKQLFAMLDRILHIPSMYPMRNLSKPTLQVDLLRKQLKGGLADGFLKTISSKRMPLLTSFYVPAIAANMAGYEPIFCIVCDADLNRVWVAQEPWESQINYFTPCGKAAQRLQSYGVEQQRIYNTGFPLDDALLGGRELTTLKHDLGIRLQMLDPNGRFHSVMKHSVEHFLGEAAFSPPPSDRVLTITYAVGGAGAQREIGSKLLHSFAPKLRDGSMKVNLVAGTRADVRDYFLDERAKVGGVDHAVHVAYEADIHDYFTSFNQIIRNTDILWTKPSELSFYAGLGLPIIMCPTIGSQEKFNRKWLLEVGAGMRQDKPDFANEWVFELLNNGRFADMAWLGFLRARKLGRYHIMDVIERGSYEKSDNPLRR